MSTEAGFERLPKEEQVRLLYAIGIKVSEIALGVGRSTDWVYKAIRKYGFKRLS